MIALLLLLLAASLVIPVLFVTVVAAGVTALALFHWMATRVYKRADRDVTAAERGPSNVHYLTPQIEADHRERRVMRLLDRS